MTRTPRFSSRLTAPGELNALAAAEAAARLRGPLFDLTTSNPTDVGLPAVHDAVARALASACVERYEPAPFGIPEARAAVARDYARRGVTVADDRVVLTASSSESYSFLFKLLADPGDVVLVPTPSYPLFDYLAALDGVALRPYRLWFDGDGWHLDRQSVDLDGARALVLVNPNNPTGSLLDRDELAWLAERCASRGVALISDEVFADYVAAPRGRPTTTVVGEGLPTLTFALGGLSKACGLPHLKLGWIAVDGPSGVVSEALARLELIADTYLSLATPVQRALPELLAIGAARRASLFERIADNARTLSAAAEGAAWSVLPREGGWSAILRLPDVLDDEGWALALLDAADVLVQPGYFFDLDLGATLVVSLLPRPDVFAEAVARLAATVQSRLVL